MMFFLRKLREVVPIVCWHMFDTSASGLAGRQGPIDISFIAAPLRSWCQLLFYSELKPQLQPESAQHAVVGQLSDRSVDMFEHQPPQHSHVFSMASGKDAAQLVCIRKHNTPLHTRMEPFSFKEDSPGLLLWLRLLLAKKDVHGFVQTQPPTVAVPGAQLSNFDLVDWRGGGNEEDCQGAGTSSRSDTAAARATSTIRSSQVWRASCRWGSEAPQDVAVKIGSRALIQHEAEMMVKLDGVAGVVQLVHSNSAQPSKLGDQRLRLPKDFNEVPFLVSAPFGRCLQFDDTAATILGAVGDIAWTIGELGKLEPPVLHRDVSIGHIMIVEDVLPETGGCRGAYLIDLATACLAEGGQYQGDSTQLTGTPLFIARSVLEGRPHTQSSDLESLLLVLIYLGCEGHVHWANCEIGTRVATALKGYSLLPELFDEYVGQRCHSDLLPAIRRLHKLFYDPYNTVVTAELFLKALCAPVAAE